MYRPYIANLLTSVRKVVNLMAVFDHGFGCYKLQFCTVQNAWKGCGRCKWKGKGGIWHLRSGSTALERFAACSTLPECLTLANQASEALSPICMRICLAVPIASSTLLTT